MINYEKIMQEITIDNLIREALDDPCGICISKLPECMGDPEILCEDGIREYLNQEV